ncbi:MAG: glycosyltransferase family 4 protein [Acidobacteriota bacterium]
MGRRLAVTALFFVHLLRDLVGTLAARLGRQWRRAAQGDDSLVVGVDIFPFFERMTGVGWYEWNLLAHLTEVDPEIELLLYAHTFGAPEDPSPPQLPSAVRTRFRFHHLPAGFLLPAGATLAVLRATVEPLLLFLDGADVFFAPNFFVPRRHLPAVRRLVATVHDLAFLRLPWSVQEKTRADLRRHLPGGLLAADALIAVSQATADDLRELLGVSPRRVHVIHEGVDPAILSAGGTPPARLPDRFLLFVSTLEPRKNVTGVLQGFAHAAAAGYPGQLVLVGRWGWQTAAAQATLAASPVRERIHHLDYLGRESLTAVLRRAEALVYPSWLEGFGLPIVEAMACGVPVITSDRSALPEVAGDAALYVDPGDPRAIAAAICRLADDCELRKGLIERGRRRAAEFDWREAARATAAVLRRAAGREEKFPDAYRV